MAKKKNTETSLVTMVQPTPPALFVFMGLPASGKSGLARAWARKHHFSYFNSEVVRTQLAGQQRVSGGEGKYSPHMTRRTYDALLTYAEHDIAAGRTVVLDAFYGACEERARLTQLAAKLETTPHFALCYCSEKVARARLAERASGGKAEADKEWQNFKKLQENLDSLDDLEPTMVVSINTEAAQEQLLEQLDFAFEKRPPITILAH